MAYGIVVTYLHEEPLDEKSEKAYIKKAAPILEESLLKQAGQLTPDHAAVLLRLADRAKKMRSIAGMNRIFRDLEEFVEREHIDLRYRFFMMSDDPREWSPRMVSRERKRPKLQGLEDVPLPPNIPRPEMWDLEAVKRAVEDGFTFLLPFIWGESLFSQNAYWIRGVQYGASTLTVGPEHTPKMELLPDGWMRAKTYFPPEMVPEEAWLGPPNENGVVQVHLEIDPETVDWEQLNRGHQIRVRRS